MMPGTVVRWRALSNPAVILSGVVTGASGRFLVVDTDPTDPFAGLTMIEPLEVLSDEV